MTCPDCDAHPHGVCWQHSQAVAHLERQPLIPPPITPEQLAAITRSRPR